MSFDSKTASANTVNATQVWTPEEIDAYLNKLSEESWGNRWPVIFYLTSVVVIGLVGNSVVFVVYVRFFQPSVTRVFILVMSFFDLITAIVGLPIQIITIRFAYNSYNLWLCRSLFIFTTLPTQSSGLVLVLIALDRYSRVCYPLEPQQTVERAWKLTFMSTMICCIVFSAFIPVYGLHKAPTSVVGIKASMCWVHDEFRDTKYLRVYTLVISGLFYVSLAIIVFTYTRIAQQLWKNRIQKQKYKMQIRTCKTSANLSMDEPQIKISRPPSLDLSFQISRDNTSVLEKNNLSPISLELLSFASEDMSMKVQVGTSIALPSAHSSVNDLRERNISGAVGNVDVPATIEEQSDSTATKRGKHEEHQVPASDPTTRAPKESSDEKRTQASTSKDGTLDKTSQERILENSSEPSLRQRLAANVSLASDVSVCLQREPSSVSFSRHIHSKTTLMMAVLTGVYFINWFPHLLAR